MEFLKNHYEKIILSITLLALAATAAWLYSANQKARTSMEDVGSSLPRVRKLQEISVGEYQTNLAKAKAPPVPNFTENHNIFNPVTWKIRPDGELMKIQTGNEEGPGALKVTKLEPLNLTIAVGRVSAGNAIFTITREAAPSPFERRPQSRYVSAASPRNEFFTLIDSRPPDATTQWIIDVTVGETQRATVTQQQPFTKVEGYAVDFRYEPENRDFNDIREGQTIILGGEAYKVVAISKNDVRLAAISTGKQFIIKVQN